MSRCVTVRYASGGPLLLYPLLLEDSMSGQSPEAKQFFDMVVYPISPTIALPTTYPMLDPRAELKEPGEIRVFLSPLPSRHTQTHHHA